MPGVGNCTPGVCSQDGTVCITSSSRDVFYGRERQHGMQNHPFEKIVGHFSFRDISCGVWDEHWMVWVGFGGLVVVDFHDLVVLVA